LQGVRRSIHHLGHEEHAQDGNQPGMRPDTRVDIGMTDVAHASNADYQRNGKTNEDGSPQRRVEPIVVFAVGEKPDNLKHQCRPQQATEPVERHQGQSEGHHAPRMGAGVDDQHDDEHQTHYEPVHHLPGVECDGQLLGYPVAARHGSQYNNVHGGQEDAKILFGRKPQTDVGKALERAAEFEEARDVTDDAEQW